MIAGLALRVIINIPPRHGKSELFSKYLPPCYLGQFPWKNVILASYGAEFAETWGARAKQVMLDCGEEVYGVTLDRQSDHHWTIAKYGGGMQTCGAGGSLTGKGADLLLIDDPVKDHREALSETQRNNRWSWLIATALTRLEPNGAVAIVMTRWHQDDVCGRLLKLQEETGEQWHQVVMPALCEDPASPVEQFLGRQKGDALWPERYPVSELEKIRGRSHFWFNGLYQQRPSPLAGYLVKQSWFRYFSIREIDGRVFYVLHRPDGDLVVAREDCVLFFTIDLAASLKTEADLTVVSVWAAVKKTGDLLWVHAVGERMEGPDQPELIRHLYHAYKPDLVGVEATAYQLTMFQNLIREGLPGFKLKADKDKLSRFLPAANAYKNGTIYHPLHAPWLMYAEPQLLNFSATADEDDYVDTCSYAAKMLPYILGGGEMALEGM